MANPSKILSRITNPLTLLLIATALAAGVAALAYIYLQKREASIKDELAARSQRKETPMVRVVVPKTDAKVNTIFNTNNFVARPVEADLVYPDSILADDFPSMEGMKLARPVLRGRPVRLTDLQQPDVADVATVVPPGSRAMTIDIDNLNSIAQTLRPNHHVDIFLISRAPKPQRLNGAPTDDKALEQATLFMQDMVVLATGKEFQDVAHTPEDQANKMVRPGEVEGASEKNFDSITLLVKPAEAAKLMVGQRMGSFRVVLRGKQDHTPLALRPLRAGDLMPAAERGRDGSIEFIVGGSRGNMVTQLTVPPSQQALMAAAQQALSPLPAMPGAPAPSAAPTDPAAASPANLPIPALRASAKGSP
ncbi:Flp pilus assembly protein CpaB [Duganella sp. FT80W]|uniref:Flp pilus assembly protein CpaB n=1 Tax=Duganella guangzhouensis TaxID=2666084 RepID=A0A6I2KZM5_9BURK|nr:Flp pilus assembly protein CpaB [Duganella guangzhouensis]MRW90367.1 Flp pilus assembly protein CpaB [Duganella guangzhouensis]